MCLVGGRRLFPQGGSGRELQSVLWGEYRANLEAIWAVLSKTTATSNDRTCSRPLINSIVCTSWLVNCHIVDLRFTLKGKEHDLSVQLSGTPLESTGIRGNQWNLNNLRFGLANLMRCPTHKTSGLKLFCGSCYQGKEQIYHGTAAAARVSMNIWVGLSPHMYVSSSVFFNSIER